MSVLDPWFQPHLFWRNADAIAVGTISIWFVGWSVRSRKKLDLPRDTQTELVRWSIVLVSWILGSLPIRGFGYGRLVFASITVAFHCWPNFSVRLVRWWERRAASGA